MLSDEEALEIKQKIISHIESTFPPEQILNAKQQIESMSSEQLERFMEKNKLMKGEDSENATSSDCVFCSIVSEKIHSVKIDENDDAIAILEINPISKGHALIIQKEHSEKLSRKALSLAKKITKKIEKKLSPKSVKISNSKVFGHSVINVLPIYKDEDFNSKREKASMEELEKIREELEKKKEKIQKKPVRKKLKEVFWLPKRVP